MSKFTKRIALGAAIAGAAGYIAGLLTAPKSGKATRGDLADVASSSRSDIEKQLKSLHTELGNLVDDAKDRSGDLNGKADKELKNLVKKARDSKEKVRQVLSAVHEGEAQDKDLQKAISDAKHAVDHIRDYLHK